MKGIVALDFATLADQALSSEAAVDSTYRLVPAEIESC
jgi:hypothetical protein